MKEQSSGNKFNKGMSTLEILIAFAIITLYVSAVIIISFGNQSVAIDTETNNEAVFKAQALLEQARAKSRQDFNSLSSSSSNDPSGSLTYNDDLTITDLSPCDKQATSTVSWPSGSKTLSVTFSTFLTDIEEVLALGGDCNVGGSGSGDWHNPEPFATIPRGSHGSNDTTDIDADAGILYITGNSTSAAKSDIMVWDASALDIPTNNTTLTKDTEEDYGLKHFNAIDVAKNNSSGNKYAYLYVGNDAGTEQFQVVDVTDPTNISNPAITKITIPGVTATTNTGGAIYFYKDKVYVGTGYLISGNELHIYGVSNPASPAHLGSFNVNHNIYKIIVRDQTINGITKTLAYVAVSTNSSSDPELLIYDVTNPGSVSLMGSFNPPGNQYGTALYLLGNKAYLGRKTGTNPNFYEVDISDPSNPSSCSTCNFSINQDINDLAVSSGNAFIGATDGIHILNVSDSANMQTPTQSPNGFYSVNNGINAIDIDDNFVYAAVNNQGSTAFYIFYPAP